MFYSENCLKTASLGGFFNYFDLKFQNLLFVWKSDILLRIMGFSTPIGENK